MLPKLDTPTYRLTLPSTGGEIEYRPFLVKEQKLLMMAHCAWLLLIYEGGTLGPTIALQSARIHAIWRHLLCICVSVSRVRPFAFRRGAAASIMRRPRVV